MPSSFLAEALAKNIKLNNCPRPISFSVDNILAPGRFGGIAAEEGGDHFAAASPLMAAMAAAAAAAAGAGGPPAVPHPPPPPHSNHHHHQVNSYVTYNFSLEKKQVCIYYTNIVNRGASLCKCHSLLLVCCCLRCLVWSQQSVNCSCNEDNNSFSLLVNSLQPKY